MTATPDVFIVGAARTPIGKFLGGLRPLKASDLGAVAIQEAMSRAGVGGNDVDEVLMGHVVQGGQGPGARAPGADQGRASIRWSARSPSTRCAAPASRR
jgi:acetyl-CoA C-acetyltransferase